MATKKKTAAQRLQAHAQETFLGRSDLIGVEVVMTGKVVNEDGTVEEVDLANFSAIPRTFKPDKDGLFSRGFYMFGKVQDPTDAGQMNAIEYQCGLNIIICHSKEW